ncbi:MAG: CHAP domain-containing protein [Butyrivibrio sp.]|nr:CHAP domain-containing protein [Butyrivibrio sp.]
MAETFTPRLTAPDKSNENYYSDKNPFYAYKDENGSRPLMMPNCTAYVYGRLMEITGRGFDGLIGGNAHTWYGKAAEAGLETGASPKLGAVCCFDVTDGGAGHISVVEEIKANGDIVTSNSAYGGSVFYLKTLTAASGYNYAPTRPFKGFIYCGIEFGDGGEKPPAGEVSAGLEVTLNSVPCYESETAASEYDRKTGRYFLWDSTVANGRVRITNTADRVGAAGQVTCWINIADVGLTEESGEPIIKAGEKYELKKAAVYDSETGASVGTRTGTYYAWSEDIVNGRVRMTNSAARAGEKGQVSFWTDTDSLKK